VSGDLAGGWGLNIGGFIACYRPRGWLVIGRGSGFGWQAVHLDGNGRLRGKPLESLSLDDLAAQIDAQPDAPAND
jgi:hypothetical protein